MRRAAGIAFLMLASSVLTESARAGLNDRLPPEAYIDPVDQRIAKTGQGIKGRPFPCAREAKEQGISVVTTVDTDRCVRMLKEQRWQGLWRNDFEGSQFCAAPAVKCE